MNQIINSCDQLIHVPDEDDRRGRFDSRALPCQRCSTAAWEHVRSALMSSINRYVCIVLSETWSSPIESSKTGASRWRKHVGQNVSLVRMSKTLGKYRRKRTNERSLISCLKACSLTAPGPWYLGRQYPLRLNGNFRQSSENSKPMRVLNMANWPSPSLATPYPFLCLLSPFLSLPKIAYLPSARGTP